MHVVSIHFFLLLILLHVVFIVRDISLLVLLTCFNLLAIILYLAINFVELSLVG